MLDVQQLYPFDGAHFFAWANQTPPYSISERQDRSNPRPRSSDFPKTSARPGRLPSHFHQLHLPRHATTMASLSSSSRVLLRALPRSSIAPLPVRALSTSSSLSRASEATGSFDSPFRGDKTSKIPDFSKYRSKSGTNSNLVFQYFMVGRLSQLGSWSRCWGRQREKSRIAS